MSPFWQDDHLTLYGGDCREVLRELPAESVHCVVTSPPYWGLRDYGVGGQLGLEATPEEFVANMVGVFREVRRVLRKDGTLWLNLGDSFGDKQLWGIPWRVAFALQADGWYLRSDIIWSKPNPMPESVTDRPTKAHEYLFLLTRSPRYYYDAEAVREDARFGYSADAGLFRAVGDATTAPQHDSGELGRVVKGDGTGGRNLRSVWNIATEPYPGAHFATFPRKLVEPCVKAGTSERGVCPECGAPWVRVVEHQRGPISERLKPSDEAKASSVVGWGQDRALLSRKTGLDQAGWREKPPASSETIGWRPTCRHGLLSGETGTWAPVPAVILDPFAGSGTTLFVAQALGRRGVGIDLSPEYLEQALSRNRQTPLGLVG